MGETLNRRRKHAEDRICELKSALVKAEQLCSNKACVYITGSFSRREASSYSDLDLFIVSTGTSEKPGLSRLDEILVKADLIEATTRLGLPEFSGDGEYLTSHLAENLVNTLGKPEDDVSNTFTARLLLLLESAPLIGTEAYQLIIRNVIAAYWRDFEGHKNDFIPAFLANDILRMWRTFCVNYEARTQSAPKEKRAKRRLKNYKLKHSRLLTCYSALLYLLVYYLDNATVTPDNAIDMISITPTERLEWLLKQSSVSKAHGTVQELLERYEMFLQNTEASEDELVRQFMDKETIKKYTESAYEFGNLVARALELVGKENQFYRLLVV